ncbi:alpha-mannosidase 2x isoform X2 [Lingula anatina]|uniref:Alpha-mannosidase n=1 Tax=Lingula anatina TaxID=7574 RepID=A0A1S3HNE0_LINAN|nr:alpha-mannosidase 2x isoform X2 [Lingula anatina]|eukprot:XP_013386554.1 alpha-mannosidase 2x isoform X2 [Lingula anatina]
MKKYMALMGAAMFGVVCFSLYLMMESASMNQSRYTDLGKDEVDVIDSKIHQIEADLQKNHKEVVGQLAQGDSRALEKLKNALDIEVHGDAPVPSRIKPNITAISRNVVRVPEGMCSFAETPPAGTDVQMLNVFDHIPFDNPNGGVWKQGFPISYDVSTWQDKPLKVILVPHSHCDPGWIKTFEAYYRDQVRHILNNMVTKLEADSSRKFMYAEISFFSRWWQELDESMKGRVRRLVKSGQFEIVTGGWVMNDEAVSHYSAMIDQMIEGHQWLEHELGVKPKSGWAIDPFGHSPTMAYFLKRMGLKNMLIQRVHYSVKKYLAQTKNLEFLWRQNWDHDGSTDMFCHMMPFYSYDVPHTCGPDPKICCQYDFKRLPGGRVTCPWRVPPVPITNNNVAQKAEILLDQYRKKASLYRNNVVLVILGDDFRYDKPEEWENQFGNYKKLFDYMNAKPDWHVQAQFGTLSDYFDALRERAGTEADDTPTGYPRLAGDFFTYADRDDHYWSGYFTSRPFYKHLDRVAESNLRKAEVLYSLATALSRKQASSTFPASAMLEKIIVARRSLALFQHHDAITGTGKDHVVIDYANMILNGMQNCKTVISVCAHYLLAKDKSQYAHDPSTLYFDVDEQRVAQDSLPQKTVIKLLPEPRTVILYNSLSQERSDIVRLYVSEPFVEVKDPLGNVVQTQTDLFWMNNEESSSDIYKVSFVAQVPALGLSKYTIRKVQEGTNPSATFPVIVMYNAQSTTSITRGPFKIFRKITEEFSIENSDMKVQFSNGGMIKSITTVKDGQVNQVQVQFVKYGTINAKEKSGAYLFLPNGPAQNIDVGNPFIRVVQGALMSEVHVFIPHVEHTVRVCNSPGTSGSSVGIHNIVDIRGESNYEIAMRLMTDIQNSDGQFFTDLNGFQMQKRKMQRKLPLQANFYPISTMAYIQDGQSRFSVMTAQSLGGSSLKTGWLEVVLDRRLMQDDNRGLMQGVKDNKRTDYQFRILLERKLSDAKPLPTQPMGYPSLLGQMSSLDLLHPMHIIPQSQHVTTLTPLEPQYSALTADLPCELHFLNLRTLQIAEGDFTPSQTAALLVHRFAFDCSYPAYGFKCSISGGQFTLEGMLKSPRITKATSTSLSLMYDSHNVDLTTAVQIHPMEINAYKVHLS